MLLSAETSYITWNIKQGSWTGTGVLELQKARKKKEKEREREREISFRY